MLGDHPMTIALLAPDLDASSTHLVIGKSRVGTGDTAAWQLLQATALTLLTSAVAIWVAARIYSSSVLPIGARIRLREALAGELARTSTT